MRPRGITPLTDRDWQRIGVKYSNNHPWETIVLERDEWDLWLDRDLDLDHAQALLDPAAIGVIERRPVSTRVGDVTNNDRTLLEAVEPSEPPRRAER